MIRDFEQKQRNRFIQITDIAISKIRRTKIFGFTNEENDYIQKQHKRLLSISKDMNNSGEVAILVDIIHWETEVIIGEANRVDISSNAKAHMMMLSYPKNTILVMHNHPSTSTFSGADFKMFCDNASIFVMTIVGNDGSIQIMEKNTAFNGQAEKMNYHNLALQYKNEGYTNNGTMAMKYIIKHPAEFNILYKHGGKRNDRE